MGLRQPPDGYPAAGQYRLLVFLTPRGDCTVVVVRRLWNGRDALDRRLGRHHFHVAATEPAAQSLRSLLARVLLQVTSRPTE